MHTLNLLNNEGLEGLAPLNIKVSHDIELNVFCLIYDQLNTPRTHPVAMECRGLIVAQEDDEWYAVSRGFDSFFSYGEKDTKKYALDDMEYHEKHDGSLIRIYMHNDRYRIASKSRATAETVKSSRAKHKVSKMHDLVYEALGVSNDTEFQAKMFRSDWLGDSVTFIFELTSPHNQVVTTYDKTELTLLAVRDNDHGGYYNIDAWGEYFKISRPVFTGTPDQAAAEVAKIKGLNEGFVGYRNGVPVIKIKTIQHVAAHHLTTNLNIVDNAIRVYLKGEMSEFLTYFPKYAELFEKIDIEISVWLANMEYVFANTVNLIPKDMDPKERARIAAQAFKNVPNNGIMFSALKADTTPTEQFWKTLDDKSRFKTVRGMFKDNTFIPE